MDPAQKKVLSPEKLAEIEARILKSKEKYKRLDRELGLEQEARQKMLKAGRMFYHEHQNEIILFEPYQLFNTTIGILEYIPKDDPEPSFVPADDCRYFYTASATLSKREEPSERVVKGYIGYRLMKYAEYPLGENPFAGQFIVSKLLVGSKTLKNKDFTNFNPPVSTLVTIAGAYFVSHYSSGEDMDGNKIPSSIVRAFRHG